MGQNDRLAQIAASHARAAALDGADGAPVVARAVNACHSGHESAREALAAAALALRGVVLDRELFASTVLARLSPSASTAGCRRPTTVPLSEPTPGELRDG